MKTVGLIAEYNPFHNGHLYHIEEAKRVTGADTVLVVMSGDYIQRGLPAFMPKRVRAEMALKCGASAVFELPVCYATGSAEYFAAGAISLLDRLGIVDAVCFGSESGDLAALSRLADLLCEEPEKYRTALREQLKAGSPFPAARQAAVTRCTGKEQLSALLEEPNNILGIEYLKALRRRGSRMKPYTIRRQGAGYHDSVLHTGYSSASAIRSLLAWSVSSLGADSAGGTFEDAPFSRTLSAVEEQVPPSCLELLKDYHQVLYPVYANDFSLLLKYKLLNKNPEELTRYQDVSPELARRICGRLDHFFNYRQFCELLKTREITQTRVNRALLHIMLGTKKDCVESYMNQGFHFYARLLGYRKDRQRVISQISRAASLPLLARLQDSAALPEEGQQMLRNDILASSLYMSVVTNKYKTAYINEYKQGILRI